MKQFTMAAALALTIGAVLVAQSTRPATPAASGDWPMYSLNLAGNRFSPLSEINTGNVSTLKQAWSLRLVQP